MSNEHRRQRRNRTAVRTLVNYEAQAPRCANCEHFVRAAPAVPAKNKPYHPPACWVNQFSPSPDGLCDRWQDKKTGDVLEVTP